VREASGGFSLLEILVAVSVFGIALAALTTTQVTSIALSRSVRETSAAADAAQNVMESIRDEDEFSEIYARWNEDTADDPAAGLSPGNAFDVRGLEPVAGDPDGRVGEVVFPGDAKKLRENGNDRTLGMPRDLDLDGNIDGADHASNYKILPVMVRVRWRGSRGTQQIQLVGTLARR
jgi:prepilin-type N-terminal cleavage/methylation domain-containing protein